MATSILDRLRNMVARKPPAPAAPADAAQPAPEAPPSKPIVEEVARPSLTGVRQAWPTDSMVAGLTPDKLDAILRQANSGDMHAFLTLAEEMEERDPHYGSVLQTRKLAVMGLDRKITWSEGDEDHPQADEIEEACEKLIQSPDFEDLLFHLLDAIPKGYAAPEIMWETKDGAWTPACYEWRDPRWFQFDRETGRELRLREPGVIDGKPLPPYKFAVHLAGRKSGLAARGGLARLVAFSFVCKLYGFKDWMAYAEIFGIPLRLGTYDASATPDDVAVLKRAVFGLGSDAAAVIPKSMTIEFPDLGSATGGAELFHTLVTWVDNQVSKAVLGQTGTTDMQKGGGFAQSTILNEVRRDLTKADAKGLAASVTAAILKPYVVFNWGPKAPIPNFELVVEDPEDIAGLADALQKLVPLGLKVKQSEVRRKMKLSEPAPDDELLTAPKTAAVPPIGSAGAQEPGAQDSGGQAPASQGPAADPAKGDPAPAGVAQPALARAAPAGGHPRLEASLDDIMQAEMEGWAPTFGAEASAVIELVRNATSFEDVTAGLQAMAKDLSSPAVARSLARAMFEAAVTAHDPAVKHGG